MLVAETRSGRSHARGERQRADSGIAYPPGSGDGPGDGARWAATLRGADEFAAARPDLVATMRRYLPQLACTLRPGSVSGTDLALRSFAAFLIDTAPEVHTVAGIERRHVENDKPWLARRPGRTSGQVTTNTITHRLATLRMFFVRIDDWGCADTRWVPGTEESNVRLPQCAFDALMAIATRRGVSRDEAVRQVLIEHLTLQESRESDDRLTHISTVLRYPAPPRRRKEPRTDRPLRLGLASGVAERARAVSLRLPGQSQRTHRDYQARLLTDAVMTAIAVQEPFTDEFLDGLMSLLRHRTAVGLWHLAMAVTSTAPENAIRDAAEEARSQIGEAATPLGAEELGGRRRLLLVAEALDEEVSWHSPLRFTVAASIARGMLSGANAEANERILYEQCSEWNEKRLDLCHSIYKAFLWREASVKSDWSGRGGAAVWRAHRRVEQQDFEDWLMRRSRDNSPVERHVRPPGWLVRSLDACRTCVLPTGKTEVPERFSRWLATGRLLAFPAQERQVLWPLTPIPDPPG
jgi:hypothetical protein